MSRYKNIQTKTNSSDSTKIQRQRRGEKEFVNHYKTGRLPTPPRTLSALDTKAHVWSVGDRFYKLAQTHYNDPKLWWVVAWYNQKPTEGHVEIGDTILVHRNIDELLNTLGY